MKIIYTAITGGKDSLVTQGNFEGVDAQIAFLDFQPEDNGSWQVVKAYDRFKDPNRNAKIHKVLAHQWLDCEYSLWIDGNIVLDMSIDEMIDKYLKDSDLALFEHYGRTNIYQEAKACKKLQLDDHEVIDKQISVYGDKVPNLYECPVILRRHTDETERFNNYWWSEICRHSRRDQLSCPFVVDKLGITPTNMGVLYGSNKVHKVRHVK